jgi:hypothetical protein
MSQLDHPNVLPVYDYGEQDGVHHIVSRCVVGWPGVASQEAMAEERPMIS